MIRWWRLFLLLSVIMLPGSVESQTGYNIHRDRIVEDGDGRGLEDVMAFAYPSDTRMGGSAARCDLSPPAPLDVDSSEPRTGSIRLHIRTGWSTYMAVYCKPGYVPEFVKNSTNGSDASLARRNPVRLMRRPIDN
jgi:hypothetical protein